MLFFPTVDEDFQYFRSQGYSGSLNDMHYKAMGDLTHTGSLTDRIHQFLVSEYGSFYEAMRDLRNSSASFIALRYGVLTKQPAYSLDFINEYYRAAGVKSNLNPAVTHTRAGQATMTDGYGAELVTNGDFSNGSTGWLEQGGWTFASGKATNDGTNDYSLTQLNLVTVGKTYRITYDVSGYVSGNISVGFNSGGGSTTVSANGSYEVTETATQTYLKGYPRSSFVGSIDNISVKETPEIKWAPHNLLTYSEDLTNSGWTNNNLTVTTGQNDFEGNTTAFKLTPTAISGIHRIYKTGANSNTTDGILTTVTIDLKADGYNFFSVGLKGSYYAVFNLSDGTVTIDSSSVSPTVTSLGNGWYRCSITSTVLNQEVFSVGETSQNATFGSSTFTGDGTSGVLVAYPHSYRSDLGGMVNNPETGDSYVPTTSTVRYLPRVGHHIYNGNAWANEGVLHESEARTNLLTYSQDFTHSSWTKANTATLALDAIGPDGVVNSAVTLVDSNAGGTGYVRIDSSNITTTVGTAHTASIYAKADQLQYLDIRTINWTTPANASTFFNLSTGVVVSTGAGMTSTIENAGNGWYRCSITFTTDAVDADGIIRFTPSADGTTTTVDLDGTSSILIYGAQFEVGSTPSSYIPTSGSTVTRAAETLTVPAANLPWPTTVEVTGTELVTNGTFDTDISGWNNDGTTSAIVGNQIEVTSVSGVSGSGVDQTITTVAGKRYKFSSDHAPQTGRARIEVKDNNNFGSGLGTLSQTSATGTYEFVFVALSNSTYIRLEAFDTSSVVLFDNVSVKEINPLSVSIQMDGRMTYADTNKQGTSNSRGGEVVFHNWKLDNSNYNEIILATYNTDVGKPVFNVEAGGVRDNLVGSSSAYSPGINVPFNLASRHGSTFLNGAVDGTALTANTTPVALPYLQATNLSIGYKFMGTIGKFRVWSDDLTDTGIATASSPSTEPSLQLTFDGSSTSSFTVLDWSE